MQSPFHPKRGARGNISTSESFVIHHQPNSEANYSKIVLTQFTAPEPAASRRRAIDNAALVLSLSKYPGGAAKPPTGMSFAKLNTQYVVSLANDIHPEPTPKIPTHPKVVCQPKTECRLPSLPPSTWSAWQTTFIPPPPKPHPTKPLPISPAFQTSENQSSTKIFQFFLPSMQRS